MSNRQSPIKGNIKRQPSSSNTFQEGSLFKQAGQLSFQLDGGAPSFFNNKTMIKGFINQAKYPGNQEANQHQSSNKVIANPLIKPKESTDYIYQNDNKLRTYENRMNPQSKLSENNKYRASQSLNESTNFAKGSLKQEDVPVGSQNSKRAERSNEPSSINNHNPMKQTANSNRSYSIITGASAPIYNKSNVNMEANDYNDLSYTLQNQSSITQLKSKILTQKKAFDSFDSKTQLQTFARINQIKNNFESKTNRDEQSYTNISQYLKENRQKVDLIKYTQDSREQYLKNRTYKTSQLLNPIDVSDQTFNSMQSKDNLRSSANLKNVQTSHYQEPTKNLAFNEGIDFINNQVKVRAESISNGRSRFISDFFEQESKPHYSPEYREKVNRFPVLFSKKKSEFSLINNALPHTSLIIKSNFMLRK